MFFLKNKKNCILKNKKIAFAGGGSGGHVFPIKSIIEFVFMQKDFILQTSSIYRFGTKNGLENKVCHDINNNINNNLETNKKEIKFISIFGGKFRRETRFIAKLKNFLDFFMFIIGIFQSLFWLLYHRIDVIFCKGGFVALPVVIAGALLRRKIIVHESDVKAGLVNRLASIFANKTFTGFPGVLKNSEHIGQILSNKIIASNFTITSKTNKTKLLITGGSLGSKGLYDAFYKVLLDSTDILNSFDFYLIGGTLNNDVKEKFKQFSNIKVYDFVSQEQMGELCYKSDIGLCRAGTTLMAEQKLYNMKLLIVPIPRTHDQYDNAKFYVDKYGDILIDQKNNFIKTLKDTLYLHKGYKKLFSNTKTNIQQIISQPKQKILESIFS